jgi:hypothetical protein
MPSMMTPEPGFGQEPATQLLATKANHNRGRRGPILGSSPGAQEIYSSMAPPMLRRCRLKVYDGSAACWAR